MPRKVRDSALETRSARSRLKVRGKPYFRLTEPGLHLGYRKLPSGPGTWIARRYSGEGAYTVVNLRTPDGDLVIADDFADADGERVMDFTQAQNAARGRRATRQAGGYTVADVMDDYVEFLASDGRSASSLYDTRLRDRTHIRPALGKLKVAALTPDRLRRWRDDMAKAPARIRTREGEQRHRNATETRARRATANRN
jgi:hypothetical protein